MKQPGTLVRHADREYLLVEGGFNAETRAVILLARPDDPAFPIGNGKPLQWGKQGSWQPIARWTTEELRIPDERHAAQSALAQTLIDDYVLKATAPPTVAWAARRSGNFMGTLDVSLPMGFAAVCHERREAAEALAGAAEGAAGEVVPIDNLPMFFTHLVREGYAGAVWNGQHPVFFCMDDNQDLQFLRIVPPKEGSDVVTEVLETSGRWSPYDGEEQIEFIDNTEACDARMVECLGHVVPMGWPSNGQLFTVGPQFGVPLVITSGEEKDAVPHGVLFTTEAAATAFCKEAEGKLTVFPVNDLEKFLVQSDLEGCVAALNPGGHRAASGILWSDGEKIVLDSFSGFWKIGPGGFEPIES